MGVALRLRLLVVRSGDFDPDGFVPSLQLREAIRITGLRYADAIIAGMGEVIDAMDQVIVDVARDEAAAALDELEGAVDALAASVAR